MKRNYSKPVSRVINVNTEGIMIPISGQTTPMEADAKATGGSLFDRIIRDGY